ncbi:MAG: hypothetical protein ACR2RF_14905, partial [Geminicoccaceae bacterium]
MHGGGGNDTLIGDEARDTYFFGRNFGQDIVQDDDDSRGSNGGDRAVFQNDRFRDARTQLRNGDLIVTTKNGRVTFKGISSNKNGVEEFQFTDGLATWNGSRLVLNSGGTAPRPGSSRPTNGNDTIIGTRGNDRINGLRGNDRLEGGQGRDTYVFDANFGRDLVRDDDGSSGSNPGDVIHFRADNLRDVRSARATGRGSNANLVITTRNGTVTIEDFQSERHGIEVFQFKDKIAVWNGKKLINPVDTWISAVRKFGQLGKEEKRLADICMRDMSRLSRREREFVAIAALNVARETRSSDRKGLEMRASQIGFNSLPPDIAHKNQDFIGDRDIYRAFVVAAATGGLIALSRVATAAVFGGAVLTAPVALTALGVGAISALAYRGALAYIEIRSQQQNRNGGGDGGGRNRHPDDGSSGNGATRGGDRGDGTRGNSCTGTCRPIVLDLDRDGSLDLVSDSQGGWTGPSDGFLAIDADGSGAIDQ